MINLLAFLTLYHSPLSVFMTNNTHSGTKRHRKIRKLPNHQNVLSFFFLFFRWASSKLCDFTTVLTQKSSISHCAVHNLTAFSQLRSLMRCLKPVTQELWLPLQHHFLHLYACTQSI